MIFFTDNLETACKTAVALGSLYYDGHKVTPMELQEAPEKIQVYMKMIGYYTIKVDDTDSVFLWADGQIARLAPPSAYGEDYIGNCPFFPRVLKYEIVPGREEKAEEIRSVLNNPKFHKVYHVCTSPKSDRIFLDTYAMSESSLPIYRMEIKDFSEEAVRETFRKTKQNESAAWYISEITRYTIYWMGRHNLSHIATKAFEESIEIKLKSIPVLALLKTRNDERKNHECEKTYTVHLQLTTELGEKFNASLPNQYRNPFQNEMDAKKFIDKLPEISVVDDIEQESVKTWPAGPYSLKAIREDAVRKYDYTIEHTSEILAQLHKEDYISNPNVSGRSYPSGAKDRITDAIYALREHPEYCYYFDTYKFQNIPYPLFNDQPDGIYITGKIPNGTLTEDASNIYRLIVIEQFKTMLPPVIIEKTKIFIRCGMETFVSTEAKVTQKGYTQIDGAAPTSHTLPAELQIGDHLDVQFFIKPSESVLKSNYTKIQLINSLTKENKLTKTSFASLYEAETIVNKLIEEQFAVMNGKSIQATNKGILLIQKLEPISTLLSANTVTSWEHNLGKIAAEADSEKARLLSASLITNAREYISEWCELLPKCAGVRTIIPCPVCKQDMYKSLDSYFCRSCGYRLPETLYDRKMEEKVIGYLCANGRTPMIYGFVINSRRTWAYLYFGEDMQIKCSIDSDYECPSCGRKLRIADDGKSLYCPSSKCGFTMQSSAYKHKLTRQELRMLFSEIRRTSLINNLHLPDGTYSGYLFLDDQNMLKCVIVEA